MFRSTVEAINYGLLASTKDRNRLAALRIEFSAQTERALGREQWDLAVMLATQAQLCGEALDAEILNVRASEIFRTARI